MKLALTSLSLAAILLDACAGSLPVITTHPQSQVVEPGSNATFSVVCTNATAWQWRFNGVELSGGTNSTLIVTNAQSPNVGYYLALAKNETGWTPSQMAYLSVVTSGQGGFVPFSNLGNSNDPATYQCPNFRDSCCSPA